MTREPVEIVSNHGRVYLVSAEDYESMAETDYLLRSPVNAARLLAAAEEVRQGRSLISKSMDELQELIDDEHRLVYGVTDDELIIIQARYHYGD